MAIKEIIKNKKYQVRVSYRDVFGEVKKIKRVVNGSLSKAKTVEVETLKSIHSKDNDFTTLTFEQLFDKYMHSKDNLTHPESLRKNKEIYKKFLSKIGRLRMNKLKPINFVDVRTEIEGADAAWNQKNKAIYLMKAITRFGYEYLDIKDNAKMIKAIPKRNAIQRPYNTLTPEEFNYIMQFEENYVFYAYFNLLYWSGLRKGEGRALYKTDIKNNGVDVSKSMMDAKQEIKAPKTRSSNRFVPLDTNTLELLKPLTMNEGKFLFGDLKPLSTSSIGRHLRACIESANISLERQKKEPIPYVRVHDLRHSHATLLIEAGENIKAVSSRLGHSSIAETQKTYIHLFKGSDIRIVNTIENIQGTTKSTTKDDTDL
jgi:Site-specific recombinase XerC